MRLYEHETKKIFELENIPIPIQYGVISSDKELQKLKKHLHFPLMVKSLVLIGGRGKAGGIKKATNFTETKTFCQDILGSCIRDYTVERILLEQAVTIESSCYVGITMNPATFNNMIMVSSQGGVNIESVARDTPEAILKIELTGNEKSLPKNSANQCAVFLNNGFSKYKNHITAIRDILNKIYALYQKYDCKVAEINPLIITPDGPVAADAKLVLDDNGLYRQIDLLNLLNIQSARHDISEPTMNELRARNAHFPYVDLLPENHSKDPEKLYVGLVPGGAGYGIFSIDEVSNIGDQFFQGKVIPVNFMDSGGGPQKGRVAEMFHLLMDYNIVDLIITSRFGGISSCDVFIRGLIDCLIHRHQNNQRIIPVYGRMVGTDLPGARDFLERSRRQWPKELQDMTIIVGNQIIMAEVIRQGIQEAFERKGWTV